MGRGHCYLFTEFICARRFARLSKDQKTLFFLSNNNFNFIDVKRLYSIYSMCCTVCKYALYKICANVKFKTKIPELQIFKDELLLVADLEFICTILHNAGAKVIYNLVIYEFHSTLSVNIH